MWLWLVACGGDDVVTERINTENQDLVVLVKDDCTDEEAATISLPLLSNVGRIEIGLAEITPGCAPLGSDHQLFVEVFDDYQDFVDFARVIAISQPVSDLDGDGDRDRRDRATYRIPRDGVDAGVYAITLQSLGAPGEMREDRFRVVLLDEVEEEGGGGILAPITQ